MQIEILRESYDYFLYMCRKTDLEISGLGKASVTEDGNLSVHSVRMVKSTNSKSETIIKPVDMAMAMSSMDFQDGEYLVWLHSHNTMGAFFSGTDSDTLLENGSNGACVGIVFNHKGEMYAEAIFNGRALGYDLPKVHMKAIPCHIESPFYQDDLDRMDKEFEKCHVLRKIKTKPLEMHSNKSTAVSLLGYGGFDTSHHDIVEHDKLKHTLPKDVVNSLWLDTSAEGAVVDIDKMPLKVKTEYAEEFKNTYGYPPSDDVDLSMFIEHSLEIMGGM